MFAQVEGMTSTSRNFSRVFFFFPCHLAIYGVRKFPLTFKTGELEAVSEMFTSGKIANFVGKNLDKMAPAVIATPKTTKTKA